MLPEEKKISGAECETPQENENIDVVVESENVPEGNENKGDAKSEKGEKKDEKPRKNRRVNQMRKDNNTEQKTGFRKRCDTWSARDLKISRALGGILRHGMMGFVTDNQGYLFLDDILKHHHFKDVLLIKFDELKRICTEMEDKKGHKMFEIGTEEKEEKPLLKVRARARTEKDKGDEEITVKKAAEYMVCIHGTYWKAWEDMKQKGISRLGRNHIHFSSGMLGKDGVVSGIRPNCEVLVYIDLKRAVSEGVKFFRGEDGVLWSDGNKQGFIPPKYFNYAVHISPTTGQQIYNEDLSDLRHNEGEAMEKKKDRPGSAMSRSEGNRGGRGSRGRGRGGGRGRGNYRGGYEGKKNDGYKDDSNEVDEEGFRKPKPYRGNRRYRYKNQNASHNQAAPPASGTSTPQPTDASKLKSAESSHSKVSNLAEKIDKEVKVTE